MTRLFMGVMVIALVIAALLTGLSHAARGEPAELTERQAEQLYEMAYKGVGLGAPDFGPTIRLMPIEQIEEIFCGRPCPGLKAAQIGDVILLRADLDMSDPLNASIFLHELVHYVQWAAFGLAKDCEDYRDRETQAYQIQFAMLVQAGARLPTFSIPLCT